jgi:AAA+ superfamily predicted ATPase
MSKTIKPVANMIISNVAKHMEPTIRTDIDTDEIIGNNSNKNMIEKIEKYLINKKKNNVVTQLLIQLI